MRVRDHIPLEQGLRLKGNRSCRAQKARQRPYSIRTRIKTLVQLLHAIDILGQRPYSIRTRIKTNAAITIEYARIVRDHIPLEQGLRLGFTHCTKETCMSETIFH